jgi:hypothetical protein
MFKGTSNGQLLPPQPLLLMLLLLTCIRQMLLLPIFLTITTHSS